MHIFFFFTLGIAYNCLPFHFNSFCPSLEVNPRRFPWGFGASTLTAPSSMHHSRCQHHRNGKKKSFPIVSHFPTIFRGRFGSVFWTRGIFHKLFMLLLFTRVFLSMLLCHNSARVELVSALSFSVGDFFVFFSSSGAKVNFSFPWLCVFLLVCSCCARASLWSCSHMTVILLLFPLFFFLLHPSMRIPVTA